ncbi:hypothetical protein ABFS83_08G044700 [Erythranthe nasuta]
MELDGKNHQKHFVLVHGACHGAWCWYKVMTRLRSMGHRVTALDMAGAGADTGCVEELSLFFDYCRPLVELMEGLPPDERVVLVGHSLGGICISLVMEKFPDKIGLAIFVAAIMPGPDFTVLTALGKIEREADYYMDSRFSFANGDEKPPTSFTFGPNFMAKHLYQLSSPEDLSLATLLVRPEVPYGGPGLSKEVVLTKEKYGSVRRGYVVCEQDNILNRTFQEWLIDNNPADEVNFISGADHMPMFSKSHELCACLENLADKYC